MTDQSPSESPNVAAAGSEAMREGAALLITPDVSVPKLIANPGFTVS